MKSNRRSLTPPHGTPAIGGVHATRRGGARQQVSARVTLKSADGDTFEGWALNVSRGGVRVILEDNVKLGSDFEVTIETTGAEPSPPYVGRIVWVQQEPDGVVCGIEFRGVSTAPPPAPSDE